ncbi:MAG TPA: NADH-quinone oxidoreductase subunit NuoF [Candidatus Saccharimonadales bacterium]|nr:NADH-quinone oxidoreductase subunit NuoF [Candidatus Saccharimonadales bacterium]
MPEKVLTRNVGIEGSATLEVYESRGGYQAIRKALGMQPDALIEEVKKSGLRGRGGAGFPCGVKWGFMPKEPVKPSYLVVNADESEPGTFKDRLLLEQDPHLCLEGFLISAYAIRARSVYVYIRGEFTRPYRVLQAAVDEARAKGYVGRNIFGSGHDCDVILHRGAGAYICGEETGLMESLEGKRGYPRLKPPFPAQSGIFGCPTTVNNVETLANVPFIVERGADWFAGIGRERNTGPKLYCMSGHLKRPGVYEADMGTPLMTLINDMAGGLWRDDRKLKAVVPGGASAAVLTAEECEDLPMDFDALAAKKSMLGSAGVIVMDDTVCMVRALERLLRFFAHESCGQCTPCRVGCNWIHRIVKRIEAGGGQEGDCETLLDVCGNMVGKTICVFSDAAAGPAVSFVNKFRSEFDDHIRQGRCTLPES